MDILDLIFPKKCITCGKGEKYICTDCLEKVRTLKSICPYCQKPSIDGMTHFKCQKKFRMDGLISFWEYEGVIRKAILGLKYKFAKEIAGELARAIINNLKEANYPQNATLVPVPMHFLKENWRGFNQTELIGSQIAKEMNWGFQDLLIKRRKTVAQEELKGKERIANVKRVFSIKSGIDLNSFQNIVIFDDVFTTGSTLKEAGKVLKRGGARNVWGLTIAR